MIKAIETARFMRRNPTKAEKVFWEMVRGRRINGRKFFRQFPLKFIYENRNRFFYADFYCSECKLVVEIDGAIHNLQKDYDELRTHIINELGMKVIRFTNEDVFHDTEKIVRILEIETVETHPRPLSASKEG